MAADALPPINESHIDLKDVIFEPLYSMGIYQGVWDMFAPDPADSNYYFSVQLDYEDGSSYFWSSPKWHEVSRWYKFANTRMVNIYTHLPFPENELALAAFSEYLAKKQLDKHNGKLPIEVTIKFYTSLTPPPEEGADWQKIPSHYPYNKGEVLFKAPYQEFIKELAELS